MTDSNKNIKKYVLLFALIIAISIIIFIIIKYSVEGEKNIPFNITKLTIISSAETEELENNDNLYQANIIQKNDIYLAIEKNEKYKKQDAIKKITFNNFSIIQQGITGTIKIYRPCLEEKKYIYTDNYEVTDSLEVYGDLNTNLKMEKMTISNQGGVLEFSIVLDNIGKITYEENESIISDGTLLTRLNLGTTDIETIVSFDMLIELSSGKTFKTTIELELPVGDIAKDGVCTNENVNLDKLVFKRVGATIGRP